MSKILRIISLMVIFVSSAAFATTLHFDLTAPAPKPLAEHFLQNSGRNPVGDSWNANSLYMSFDGHPRVPVMGEMHYIRVPESQWEESILQMKAAGVQIISTYVFWIYHEEQEGVFDWKGRRDLRHFLELCKKHKMLVWLRIGPWCHGEVRNGGFPDWVVKKGWQLRTSDPHFLGAVKKFDEQIGKQTHGMFWQNGGPIIGVQLANEKAFASKQGLDYMKHLKALAQQAGIEPPFFSATKWPSADFKQRNFLLFYGGYAAAPWDRSITKLSPRKGAYVFEKREGIKNEIGTDLLGKQSAPKKTSGEESFPYLTTEIGGGNQDTYHRRPQLSAADTVNMAYVKVGSGVNLLGFYMFRGGSNLIGKYSTLQESRATHYPNDMQLINYDFQAPIGEWGNLHPSYRGLKALDYFLNDFGDRLAPDTLHLPKERPKSATDTDTPRVAIRARNGSGFIFFSNHTRDVSTHDITDVQLSLTTNSGKIKILATPFVLKNNAAIIWPLNQQIEGARLIYATAQPLCILRDEKSVPLYVFSETDGAPCEYHFDAKTVIKITHTADAKATLSHAANGDLVVKIETAGTNCIVNITTKSGKKFVLLTLTHKQALNAWKTKLWGCERLLISPDEIIPNSVNDTCDIRSKSNEASVSIYPPIQSLHAHDAAKKVKKIKVSSDGIFAHFQIPVTPTPMSVRVQKWNSPLTANSANSAKPIPLTNKPQPGPLYGAIFHPIKNAQTWKIELSGVISLTAKFANNDLLQINYLGDTAALYSHGKLIADNFYAGAPMLVSLHAIVVAGSPDDIVLQIVPLTAQRRIFLEDAAAQKVRDRPIGKLQSIRILNVTDTFLAK